MQVFDSRNLSWQVQRWPHPLTGSKHCAWPPRKGFVSIGPKPTENGPTWPPNMASDTWLLVPSFFLLNGFWDPVEPQSGVPALLGHWEHPFLEPRGAWGAAPGVTIVPMTRDRWSTTHLRRFWVDISNSLRMHPHTRTDRQTKRIIY